MELKPRAFIPRFLNELVHIFSSGRYNQPFQAAQVHPVGHPTISPVIARTVRAAASSSLIYYLRLVYPQIPRILHLQIWDGVDCCVCRYPRGCPQDSASVHPRSDGASAAK